MYESILVKKKTYKLSLPSHPQGNTHAVCSIVCKLSPGLKRHKKIHKMIFYRWILLTFERILARFLIFALSLVSQKLYLRVSYKSGCLSCNFGGKDGYHLSKCVRHLSIYLSHSVSMNLYMYPFIYLILNVSIYLFVCLRGAHSSHSPMVQEARVQS